MKITAAIILMLFGFFLLSRAFRTRTAYVSMVWYIAIMSLLMAVHVFSFISGIVITVVVSLIVIWLDEAGTLA